MFIQFPLEKRRKMIESIQDMCIRNMQGNRRNRLLKITCVPSFSKILLTLFIMKVSKMQKKSLRTD